MPFKQEIDIYNAELNVWSNHRFPMRPDDVRSVPVPFPIRPGGAVKKTRKPHPAFKMPGFHETDTNHAGFKLNRQHAGRFQIKPA